MRSEASIARDGRVGFRRRAHRHPDLVGEALRFVQHGLGDRAQRVVPRQFDRLAVGQGGDGARQHRRLGHPRPVDQQRHDHALRVDRDLDLATHKVIGRSSRRWSDFSSRSSTQPGPISTSTTATPRIVVSSRVGNSSPGLIAV